MDYSTLEYSYPLMLCVLTLIFIFIVYEQNKNGDTQHWWVGTKSFFQFSKFGNPGGGRLGLEVDEEEVFGF